MTEAVLASTFAALMASALIVTPRAWWMCRSSERVTRTTGLEIVDQHGRPRLVLSVDAAGSARMSALDRNGRMRAGLFVRPDGASGITFWNSRERLRTMIGAAAEGTPFVGLWDTGDRLRAEISIASDGTPGLSFWDTDDRVRLLIGTRNDGAPTVALLDSDGDPVWTAPLSAHPEAHVGDRPPPRGPSQFWQHGCRGAG
jgi:ABC-type amino acid transport substrate-binding protein